MKTSGEKFKYGNFLKFQKEIASNPNVFKQRDFLAEKALDFFNTTAEEFQVNDNMEVLKQLYRAVALSFYLTFKDNDDPSVKIDKKMLKQVEKDFPEDVAIFRKSTDAWNYYLTYYSAIVDVLVELTNVKLFKDDSGELDIGDRK